MERGVNPHGIFCDSVRYLSVESPDAIFTGEKAMNYNINTGLKGVAHTLGATTMGGHDLLASVGLISYGPEFIYRICRPVGVAGHGTATRGHDLYEIVPFFNQLACRPPNP